MMLQIKIQAEDKIDIHRIMTHLEAKKIVVLSAKLDDDQEVSLSGKRASQFGKDTATANDGKALRLAIGLKNLEKMDLMGLRLYAKRKGLEKESLVITNSADLLALIKEKVFNI